MADFSPPVPKYSFWETLSACLSLSTRAIEEVRALAKRPPVRGPKGEDGRDGLGFDDPGAIVVDPEKGVVLRLTRGDQIRDLPYPYPVMMYRGVFKDGEKYFPGMTVHWGGSCWICNQVTVEKPDDHKAAWLLMAKKGRDGKDLLPRQDRGPVKL